MISEFSVQRRVVFSDTDTAGMLHFAQFFIYMEDCEHQFLKSLGQAVFTDVHGVKEGWPRVDARCNFREAIQFDDHLDIKLLIRKIGKTSIQYQFQMRKVGQEKLCALGSMTAVHVFGSEATAHKPAASAIPSALLQHITEAPHEAFCDE